MKTLKFVPIFLVAFLFCNLTAIAQDDDEEEEMIEEVEEQDEVSTITGVYNGMEDEIFVFTFKDEDGENSSMSFEKISEEARKMFDLSSEKFVGKTFKIDFITENIVDNDDDMLESIRTIISLKQL